MKNMSDVVNIARLRSIVSLVGVLAVLFAEVFWVLVNMEISNIPILFHGLMVIFLVCYFYWDNRAKKINRTVINEEAARSYTSYRVFYLMLDRRYILNQGVLKPYIFIEKMLKDVQHPFYAGRLFASFVAVCPVIDFGMESIYRSSKKNWIDTCKKQVVSYLRLESDELIAQQFLAGIRERHPEMAKTMKEAIGLE